MARFLAGSVAIVCFALLLGCDSSPAHVDFVETVDGVSFVMKAIPRGEFIMGCGAADEPCEDHEWVNKKKNIRQRAVAIDAFFMAETETTWRLYQLCIDGGACPDNTVDGGDNGWGKDARPVIEVSRDEITGVFLPWLNRKTGKQYRLPFEAEWEYAARAGSSSRYFWGPEIECNQARYGYSSGDCGKQFGTNPVKSYGPNAFGLYDVHGNVWEFVADCWNGEPSPGSSSTAGACQEFVMRGGSWLNDPNGVRSATRFRHDRRFRESGDGFRLALDAR